MLSLPKNILENVDIWIKWSLKKNMNTGKEGHQWTPMNCVKSVINIEISMKTNK